MESDCVFKFTQSGFFADFQEQGLKKIEPQTKDNGTN